MLPQNVYQEAHKEFPHKKMYPNNKKNCNHKFNFVIYCDGKNDIVRCLKCGKEIEVICNFDYDFY